MSEALTEHDVLLRSTIEANGGVVFSTGGDGFAAAFADAASALRAAVEAQDRVRLPVRMGLHTGTAEERDGNYFGRTLNRAARIMSAGPRRADRAVGCHGGADPRRRGRRRISGSIGSPAWSG